MDCKQTRVMIDEMLSGVASKVQLQVIEQHTAGCEQCNEHLKASRQLVAELSSTNVPEPSVDFEERIFKELDSGSNTRPGYWFAAGFGSAVAASILFVIVFFQDAFLQQQAGQQKENLIVMSVQEVKNVSLVFTLPEAMQMATIRIELPEHVNLKGYPNRKVLSWKTSFKSGANRLNLPLVADSAVQGTIVARLIQGSQTRDFKIKLKAKEITTGSLMLKAA